MIQIYDLRCVQETIPSFSWRLEGDCGQLGYQIVVRDDSGAIIWDSGFIKDVSRHNIPCGIEPAPGGYYHWTVICEGTDGSCVTADGPAFFTGPSDWLAEWIEPSLTRKPLVVSGDPHKVPEKQADPLEILDPAVYLRSSFILDDELPVRAPVYITAHGIYALWVNGIQVADLFAPGYTSYKKRLEFQCYDVASFLTKGTNVIGVVLADGWYTGKIGAVGMGEQYGKESAILLQMECKYSDGNIRYICSDSSFRWTTGAWRYADLFIGEYYDAGCEPIGWLEPEFNDNTWSPVKVLEYGYKELALQSIPPVREIKTITPKVLRTPEGDLLLDAGETIVGFTSICLNLKNGDVITLEHSETIDANGNFLQNIIVQNKQQTDIYKCSEDGLCRWHPQFTFHGFRYVRVRGTQDCDPAHYTIHVIATPLKQTGEFFCSDERLNHLQENIVRSQQGNMINIPMDCPQREKSGWTGDVQVYAPTACYEMDMEQFLRHWLQDMENEQKSDGQIPHIVPYFPSHDTLRPPGMDEEVISAAGWSDASIIVPWRLYEAYGDLKVLREFFPMMHKYMEAIEHRASILPMGWENMTSEQRERQKYLWNTDFQFGDWLMPGVPALEGAKLTGSEVATLMFAMTTDIMSQVCEALGELELKLHYKELNRKVRAAFAAEYMNADGTMKKKYQGIYVLALAGGAVPDELRPVSINHLVELIHENGDLLGTGFLSVPYLLPVLHENGEQKLANRLLFRDESPSWLYEIKMGATTMWESWDAYAEDGTPSNYSMNHFAFGCVGEYLFRTILGIHPLKPGFSKVHIKPDLECGLTYVQGMYECIWGKIEVSWRIVGSHAMMDVVIPPDVHAEVAFGDKHVTLDCGTWHLETEIRREQDTTKVVGIVDKEGHYVNKIHEVTVQTNS